MPAGSEVEGLRILDEIPSGHKVAIQQIEKDAAIVKYGQVIGFASEPTGPGQHVHSHNVMVTPSARTQFWKPSSGNRLCGKTSHL